jgi:undecaprenyl-diphosphatase
MWDIGIFEALNYDGGAFWDEFWWTVTGKLTWVPLYVLIIWLLVRRMGWRRGLLAVALIVAAVGAADLIAGFFKSSAFVWARPRPTHTEGLDVHFVHNYRGGFYGTVSAHAATAAAVATVSAWLMRRRWFTAMMVVWALMVSYSRIYVAAHFPQDILLGLALGVTLGVVMILIWRTRTGRRRRGIA